MKYLSTLEAGQKWGISRRRVRLLCQSGQIEGCVLAGTSWRIPDNAPKPTDRRTRPAREKRTATDCIYLFLNAEYAATTPAARLTEDDRTLCALQQIMLEGRLEESFTALNTYRKGCRNPGYRAVAAMLQYAAASYLGKRSAQLWVLKDALHLDEAALPYLTLYTKIYRGEPLDPRRCVDLPPSVLPQLLYLSLSRQMMAGMHRNIHSDPLRLEMACTQLEQAGNNEITAYCHALLATYYSNPAMHDAHAQKALEIILPRRWYLILAGHCITVNWNLSARLDPQTLAYVEELELPLCKNLLRNRVFQLDPSDTELDLRIILKVAYQLALRRSNTEIGRSLGLSLYTVKKYVNEIYRLLHEDPNRTDRDTIGQTLFDAISEI